MDSYEKRVKKLQDQAMAQLQKDFAKAEAEAKTDPVKTERRLFAFELGRARINKNLSQTELAARTGMQQADVSRIESGKGNPSLNTLLKIARALDANLVLK